MRFLVLILLLSAPLLACTGEGCPVGQTLKHRVCVEDKADDDKAESTGHTTPDASHQAADAAVAVQGPACIQYAELGQACTCACTDAGCKSRFEFTDGACCKCMGARGVICHAKVAGACPPSL
jgi:hypothetical protein